MKGIMNGKNNDNSAFDKKDFFDEVQSCPQDLGRRHNISNDSAIGDSLTGLEDNFETSLQISNKVEKGREIILDATLLSEVKDFKAIVAPGNARPLLTKEKHEDIVREKFLYAQMIENHITLFRVSDKKTLGPKEIKEHTVQGPYWTPPSSLGFVLGAINVFHRIWLATKPTGDKKGLGLLDNKGEPSIFAREIMVAVKLGWSARESKFDEQYGKTGRGPEIVLTPPSSPVPFDGFELKNLMDVDSGWDALPMKAFDLARVTLVPRERLAKYLLENGVEADDFEDNLLEIVSNNKILTLLEIGVINLDVLSDVDTELLKTLLHNKKVIKLLQLREIEFDYLLIVYDEFFDNGKGEFSYIDFEEFYKFYSSNQDAFKKLTGELDMSIGDIVRLIHDFGEIMEYLISNDAIEFLKNNVEGEVCIEWLGEICRSNQDLFYALILDECKILDNISVEDFVDRYKHIQREEEKSSKYGLSFAEDPYDILYSRVIKDFCPDGWSGSDSEDEDQWSNCYSSYSELSDSEYENDILGGSSGYLSEIM